MKNYSIESLKNATDKYLEDLKNSQYIYCLTCGLAEKILAYSKNFTISYNDLLEGTNSVTFTKIAFKYLDTYQFVVQVSSRKCGLYPNTFTVSASKEGYDIGSRLCTDNINEVFDEIVKIAEGKNV